MTDLKVCLAQDGPIPLAADFTCRRGELLALVGPSGSGKTTLLRSIAGLYQPAEGHIVCGETSWFDGKSKYSLSPQKRRVGIVFQDYALFPHLTALENIALPLRHLPKPTQRDRAEQWLSSVRLEGLGQRYPHALSGGQRQRVALARALAREPEVLLLDEPFSAVDQVTRRRLQRELALLRQQIAIPIVLVTHDLDEATALADQICVLHGGESLQQDTPDRLFRQPATPAVARLLDRHNLFNANVVTVDGQRYLQWGRFSLEVTEGLARFAVGEAVTWYLPPSDIVLHRRDRPSRGERENPIPAMVSEVVALGGITLVTLRVAHGDMLRFDIATHAARRNHLAPGAMVNVSLLAAGIHIMPGTHDLARSD
ncbi:ABC transporter ATP-binding protein [Halomonas vilamensis]|uniref:ABC transporter ATP-binding protein n=1 Tax=Vreelandella vilamensis TaxID=531309 RepID=A0ABU1H1I9_9GAMM|nr:ABC transporter ATP-binding protein [Halomonas vilamensis]MDR5897522.1 ABC transporter ATP-binding protein [Halomonas vilamensis]